MSSKGKRKEGVFALYTRISKLNERMSNPNVSGIRKGVMAVNKVILKGRVGILNFKTENKKDSGF